MKKTIKKFWGIAIIVTLLASMLVSAAPASAGTLKFTAAGVPGGVPGSNQIADTNIPYVKVAPNGDIFTFDTAADELYKSTDGGYTWKVVDFSDVPYGYDLKDIAFSPSYATDGTVFAVCNDGGDIIVLRSVNSGATFSQLGGIVNTLADANATSIDVEPTYLSGVGMIIVGAEGVGGGVYVWGLGGALNWVPLGTVMGSGTPGTAGIGDYSVYDVAFSPLYPIDSLILAVAANSTGSQLHAIVQAGEWDQLSSATYPVALSANATDSTLHLANMVFPSDFNGSLNQARNVFVGLDNHASAGSGVYRVNGSAAKMIGGSDVFEDSGVWSLAHSGTYASGTLYAGLVYPTVADAAMVYKSTNANTSNTLLITWSPLSTGITGERKAAVALNGNLIYVGTSGPESAFSVSTDGVVFQQYGQIDTDYAKITDMTVISTDEWYLVSTGSGVASLWHTTNGGARYTRIAHLDVTSGCAGIALSQNFATDMTMYFYEKNGSVTPAFYLSNDGGKTWQQRAAPFGIDNIADVIAVDQYTVYVGDGNSNAIYKSVNNGWTYAKQKLEDLIHSGGIGYEVAAMKYDASTGAVLAATTDGFVFISTDGTTFTSLGNVPASWIYTLAFDANFATNNMVYASSHNDIMVYTVGDSTEWDLVFAASSNATEDDDIMDMLVAPDGVLYASTKAEITGGLIRILNPYANPLVEDYLVGGVGTGAITKNIVDAHLSLSLGKLQWASGSNVIYAVSGDNMIGTYDDTLSTVMPTVTSPASGDIVSSTALYISIDKVSGAKGYEVEWDTRADWATTSGPIAFPSSQPDDTAKSAAIAAGAGKTVYFRVRVSDPLYSPWSATMSVNTLLAPAGTGNLAAPAIIGDLATEGSTNNGGYNVDPNATFFWGAVYGATGYEFQLATDPGMTNLVVDATGSDAINQLAYTVTTPLAYGQTYYWRVRAVSASSNTPWTTVAAFTVMEEPVVVTPTTQPPATITLTTQPAPTITFTQPAATTTTINIPAAPATEEIAPAYIWVIIIIGAVLVIAVIVLIVRTRRTV